MLQQFANSITDMLLAKEIGKVEDRDIYIYGFEAMLSTVINTLLILLIGVLTGMILETLIFLLGFAILRVYCGGYHAQTHVGCILTFAILYGLAMGTTTLVPIQYAGLFSVGIGAASLAFILKYAPLEHPNRPFVGNEFINFRKLSRMVSFIETGSIVIIAVFLPSLLKIAVVLSLAMFNVAFILALAKIIERKR